MKIKKKKTEIETLLLFTYWSMWGILQFGEPDRMKIMSFTLVLDIISMCLTMITKCQKSGKWQKIFKSEKVFHSQKKSSLQKNLQK